MPRSASTARPSTRSGRSSSGAEPAPGTAGPVGRFAPSPTGALHFGGAVTALASWLAARHAGGGWRLRIDDHDPPRTRAQALASLPTSLARLGLHWDGPIQFQQPLYAEHRARRDDLLRQDLAYWCGCSRREIAAAARPGPAGRVYGGHCRELGLAPAAHRSVRLRVDPLRTVTLDDGIQGRIGATGAELGDFLIWRADDLPAYQLAAVGADAAAGITQLLRGYDLVHATLMQQLLREALRLAQPQVMHVPLATNPAGVKLSKASEAVPVDRRAPPALLRAALQFLGQPAPPIQLHEPETILAFACEHWQLAAVPRLAAKPAPPVAL
ncbi:MAG TPA: tRNA glutamyl-Q(34) synthetase GluQRS [Gammaproteobacteria bacterium]|nr:tRNA glutamyl-Q(34) synthetase GluQRS [Gammaproteobacteria bacterium]